MDKISVIVPVYNVEKYVSNCIMSIINQTYINLEIILVDDGSTDLSSDICDKFAKEDKRIIVIHKKNGGLSDARNIGIDNASGLYLTFVDSDDYLPRGALSFLHSLIVTEQDEIAIGKLYKTSIGDAKISDERYEVYKFNHKSALREMLYGKLYSTAAPGKLYKASLFQNIRFPHGKLNEDLFTIYKVIDKANTIVYSNKIVYFYFHRIGSIMTSSFTQKRLDSLQALEDIAKNISLIEYDAIAAYSSQYIENIIILMELQPTKEEIKKYKLWALLKENRINVIKDLNANKRVKYFAFLSFFGKSITIFVINYYYSNKWGSSKRT